MEPNLKPSLTEILKERDNALEWVKENLKVTSDFKADGLCHAIQVFINRIIIPRLERQIEELQHLLKEKPLPVDSYGSEFEIYKTSEVDEWFNKLEKLLGLKK